MLHSLRVLGDCIDPSDSVQGSTTFDDDAILSSDLLNKHDPGENRTSIALAAPSHTNMAVMSVTEKRSTLGHQLASATHALAGHADATMGAICIDKRSNDAMGSYVASHHAPQANMPVASESRMRMLDVGFRLASAASAVPGHDDATIGSSRIDGRHRNPITTSLASCNARRIILTIGVGGAFAV